MTTLEDCLWNPRGAGGKRDDGAAVDMLLPRFPPSLSLSIYLSILFSLSYSLSLILSQEGRVWLRALPRGRECVRERNGTERPVRRGAGEEAMPGGREEVRYMHRSSYLCIILASYY